jgi:hypothetical protein
LAVSILAAASVLVTVGTSGAGAGEGGDVRASAKFTVDLGDQSDRFNFRQSGITNSTLRGTPQVPVSLHASPKSDDLEEFVLAGRVEKGEQETSEDLALGLNVTVGDTSMFLSSTDGECSVKVRTLTDSRIAGSFTCDTTYGGDPLTAEGRFKAR